MTPNQTMQANLWPFRCLIHNNEIAGLPRRTYFWTLPVAVFGSLAYRQR